MAEQSNQFNPEQLTPEEWQLIKDERSRVEQQQAGEFASEMQREAESRFTPTSNLPKNEPIVPDTPGITSGHKPIETGTEIFPASVKDLNDALERGLEQYLDGTKDLNASDAIEMLAKLPQSEN